MRLKTLLAIVIAVVALAALVAGTAYCTSYITESVGDPSRFSFVGITANGVTLGADEADVHADYTADTRDGEIVSFSVELADGLTLWVEAVNHERDLTLEDARTIEEVRLFLKGDGKKGRVDKETGLRSETYNDVLNQIKVEFIYNDSDGTLTLFTAAQED
ncbi:MAG: hypothetical protein LBK23_10805 [Oscillospiraceae bacterium]|jgi:hypothetical protein|nr:hypothetical protein [Oscillospiraceae bacterium]